MKIREIEEILDRLFPKQNASSWDHDGLLVCADRERETDTVLTALDVTFGAIEEASRIGAGLIVSHHPMIFHPLNAVSEDTLEGQKALALLQNGISLISCHTRFDATPGGLNDTFARALGVSLDRSVMLLPDDPLIGGVGELPYRLEPRDFARKVAAALDTDVRLYSADLAVKKIGLSCGSAKDLVAPSLACGADAFVGGDIPYHTALDAVERGMTVIDCGHFGSEKAASGLLRRMILSECPDLNVVSYQENTGGEIVENA